MKTRRKTRQPRVSCSRCGRKLDANRWVYSAYTRAHYCWPGQGCNR